MDANERQKSDISVRELEKLDVYLPAAASAIVTVVARVGRLTRKLKPRQVDSFVGAVDVISPVLSIGYKSPTGGRV